jgi:hypothetical protein
MCPFNLSRLLSRRITPLSSATSEYIRQAPETVRHLFFDRAFGNAQALRDLSLGKTFYAPQHENLTHTGGQGRDCCTQPMQLVAIPNDRFGIRLLVNEYVCVHLRE